MQDYKKRILKDIDVKKDKTISDKLFLSLNLNAFARLLSNDKKAILGKKSMLIRKAFHPILKASFPLFASTKLITVRKEELPKDVPLIFAPTHGFRDDVSHSLALSEKHAYILFGSLPAFFNSFDGPSAWLNGVIMLNRKDNESKKTAREKSVYAIELGTNLLIYPEGVWNKTPNVAVQKLFPGIYDIAKDSGAYVVPIITMQENGVTYGIRDKGFDISQYDKKEGLMILRDKLATGKYEIMEKYCQAKREDFGTRQEADDYWQKYLDELIATAGFYDHEFENKAHFVEKNEISEEEVFAVLDDVELTKDKALVLVKTKNNYKRY